MRAITKIATVGLILFTSFSFAGNGERDFRKMIKSKIMYPFRVSQKVDTEVYVEFTVTDKSEIRIDYITCPYAEICSSISEQLQSLKLDPNNTEIINKIFAYKFILEVEKQ